MNKTTEELWEEAADSFNRIETFRNLVIQNERDCAEPVGYFYKNERGTWWHQAGDPIGMTKLFTFPPAPQASGDTEPIYAFRRKGLTDFCTCDRERFIEFSQKPKLFEVKMFFTFPPPPQPYQVPEGYALIGIPVLKAWGKYEEVNEACKFPAAPHPCPSKKDAIEALDNMDDYARMDIGVDAIGPRKVLEDYINQHCPGCEKLKEELRRIDMAFDDERINLTHTAEDLVKEQAAEIANLKDALLFFAGPENFKEALAAIKEIEK